HKKEHEEHLKAILELLKKEELDAKFSKCLAGYYRRFIEGFSKIAKPMTKLTQKKVAFVIILDQKELNMRQRHWLELLSDYDCEIRYPTWGKQMLWLMLCAGKSKTEAHKPENLKNEDVGGMIRKDLPKERLEPRTVRTEPYV
ncbi:hypothetical protein Tco_0136776, partial [Tanacetum coccineum]